MVIDLSLFNDVILWILGAAGVVSVLDNVGFLPARFATWFARNRQEATLKSLTLLGVRVRWDEGEQTPVGLTKRVLISVGIEEHEYKVLLRQLIDRDTFDGKVRIGESRSFLSDSFVDVMGGTTSYTQAVQYAKILNTHAHIKVLGAYDIIATPKAGSPILGYEFSRLVEKPLVLGLTVEKAEVIESKMGPHTKLDFPRDLILRGKKILIVDDSTTGGRKVVDLAENLRKEGALVSDVLVLFEPSGKGARALLKERDLLLHSVMEGPRGSF